MSEQGARVDLEQAAIMSRTFRAGLGEMASGRDGVKLRPNELRLGYQLCLETLDEGLMAGRVDLDRWARLLELRDAKGFRPDKAASILQTLTELGIVDVNAAQATFEPRPDSTVWLRARAMRARALSSARGTGDPAELPLRAERPLSEALSELSRENAVGQPLSYSHNSPGATPAPTSADFAESSDKSDDVRRINPTTNKSPGFAGESVSSEKSDDPRARAGRSETCTRLGNVQKTCTTLSSEKSDEPDPRRRRRVQERVRAFVGDEDWARKGSWGSAFYIWESALAIEAVDGCLDYLISGLKDGSIRIKKSPGGALWWYYRHTMTERQHNQKPVAADRSATATKRKNEDKTVSTR